jgi:hypothetical protein
MGPISEKKQRPDYPDIDGDGDTEEPMVKAAKDKEKAKGKVDEYAAGFKPPRKKLADLDILPRHKRLQNEMAFTDYIAMLKALGYDISDEIIDESFDSLVKKVDKAKGYTKKEAEKVAGAIAAKKMKGAGKGPTAKQKARMAETILKELRG